jgi:hypothetical protein
MGKAIVVQSYKVAERWSCILEGMQGNATRIYQNIAAEILSANLPHIYLERTMVRPSHWTREEREFLLVTNRLKEYPIYIGAQDYGHNLAINWYLVVTPGLFAALSSGDLDLFELQDLHAHVTIIHRCLRKAVTELLLSFGQDASFLEPKSTGFLGVT